MTSPPALSTIRELQQRWSLTLGDECDASCAWVAHATLRDGTPAILKLAVPHMEGDHEIAGLRFWNGDPTVRLIDADDDRRAMLLERCDPGTSLRSIPEPEQDVVIAGLLHRLWRPLPVRHSFRPLSTMLSYWRMETLEDIDSRADTGLVQEGLRLFDELSRPASDDVLLATDLHAGNVLRATRMPWLVIDPKPFAGDRAYDATQHLLNCPERLRIDAHGTIARVAELLEVDRERVRLWTFARAAAEPSDGVRDEWMMGLARTLARRAK